MKLNVKYAQLISSTKLDQLFNVNPVQSSQLMRKSHNICKFIYDLSEKSKETGPKTSGSSHVRAGQCPVSSLFVVTSLQMHSRAVRRIAYFVRGAAEVCVIFCLRT